MVRSFFGLVALLSMTGCSITMQSGAPNGPATASAPAHYYYPTSEAHPTSSPSQPSQPSHHAHHTRPSKPRQVASREPTADAPKPTPSKPAPSKPAPPPPSKVVDYRDGEGSSSKPEKRRLRGVARKPRSTLPTLQAPPASPIAKQKQKQHSLAVSK
jgi:hypothetical protein